MARFPSLYGWVIYTYSCCCSVAQSCPTLCDPMDCSMPGLPVPHHLPEFSQVHALVMPSSHLTLWCPLLLLPSIFPSIRDFSSESAVCIRWPKYWSFSISSSNKYSRLISLKIDGFELLAVQGTLRRLVQHRSLKVLVPPCSAFFVFIHTHNRWIPNTSFFSVFLGHSQRILLQKAPTYRNPHASWMVFG